MLKEIISGKLVTVEPDAKLIDVARKMKEENVGAILVLTDGKPRGIITDRDIVLRCVAENLDCNDTTVENVLTEAVMTVKEYDGLYDAIRAMRDAKVRRIPVVDREGNAVGIVSFGDVVAILSKELAGIAEAVMPAEHVPDLKAA